MAKRNAIVSSEHLVSRKAAELSQLEYALINAGHAFERWMVHCMTATGIPDLSPLDVLVLHNTNHRSREKTLAGICLVLNVEDTHLVNYSLKKLRRLNLIEARRRGKEMGYTTTDEGRLACQRYREIREACLIDALAMFGGPDPEEMAAMATRLRALSGIYDQAARAASSL
ncbi:putative MarR family transcription regulator [Natronocella acetinitrilica]|uniref:MarR family transcription regulator n=1 Tax=Natronocella acetinitrilica TaxID=414046 RepID=A0AAE3G1F5_9GAMM|nr:winged helix DNA-binding protein [Natronocella acetinitrilica]MCP1674050.1 putative MarR family transcription regulator [Natronocella acetinitrilica]